MKFIDTVRLAIAGVTNNKFRSFLTLLGIIIGVGAVILMVSLGSGTQKVVAGQFEDMDIRLISLGANYQLPYQKRGKLSLEDELYLERSAIGVKEAIPYYSFYSKVKYGRKEIDNHIVGATLEALDISNLKLKYGRFLNEDDIKGRNRVVILGEPALRSLVNLADYSSMLGKYIYIDSNKLLIVGILDEGEGSIGMSSNSIIVPSTTANDLWRHRTKYVSHYLITYDQASTEKDIREQISYLMDQKYGKTSGGKSKYTIAGLAGQINIINKVLKVFTYLLGGIATISLLVGGIGVMNIMLVTVKERTKEIGLRLAIGATRKDIQNQFLIETVMLSISGGILGILTGLVLSGVANFAFHHFFDFWQGGTPFWVVVSFVVTVLIGIIFGFYPAYKASKLDHIDALR